MRDSLSDVELLIIPSFLDAQVIIGIWNIHLKSKSFAFTFIKFKIEYIQFFIRQNNECINNHNQYIYY